MDYELVQTALRVLKSAANYQRPASEDVEKLQSYASGVDPGIPHDELARRIVLEQIGQASVDSIEMTSPTRTDPA